MGRYWLQTLGCPKNQVDSDKLEGYLESQGLDPAAGPESADLVVVNTCAFIHAARQESIDTVLELADRRPAGSRLVVTGCMAERYGEELRAALPEVDLVAGFGRDLVVPPKGRFATNAYAPDAYTPDVYTPDPAAPGVNAGAAPVTLGRTRRTAARGGGEPSFDLLTLPRPASRAPWAYVKVAEGCDRICGFCAIPSFRGRQRSRSQDDVLAEVDALLAVPGARVRARTAATEERDEARDHLEVREIVLVAQDLASYGRDRSGPHGRSGNARAGAATGAPIAALTRAVSAKVERTRLLYLYPSGLTDDVVEAILQTGVPYFDLSLQHVSRPHLARMRRWGDGERFLRRLEEIRAAEPAATFRSSFILGYPGETERDHDLLLEFLNAAQLDWAGFFPFSPEVGTHAVDLPDQVPSELALERLRECGELQDAITATKRDDLVGTVRTVLVDAPGRGRTVHEAPEIDGIVHLPPQLGVGRLVDVRVTGAVGPDLHAVPIDHLDGARTRDPHANGAVAAAAAAAPAPAAVAVMGAPPR